MPSRIRILTLTRLERMIQPETQIDQPTEVLDDAAIAVSEAFVGRWNVLVSQTNWEKGRIIFEWRAALMESGASATAYSDEAWARSVGAVTSQHVGRLRRVYERFGQDQASYSGLYWSHFLAAIEWDDAELWLEGAVRSEWSVSEMRRMRSEASVAAGGEPESDEELITSEVDDGFVALATEEEEDDPHTLSGSAGPLAEGPDFGDADEHSDSDPSRIEAAGDRSDNEPGSDSDFTQDIANADRVNPFTALGDLPPDVAEAVEHMKLAIIRHRAATWNDMSQSKMLQVIDALKSFAQQA
jgi:hypothetical protein